MKFKPSSYHAASVLLLLWCGASAGRHRTLKAGHGKGKQPETADNARHRTQDRDPM